MREAIKMVTVTAVLCISCLLPYTTNGKLSYLSEFNATVERVSLNMPATVPTKVRAISHELDTEARRIRFDMPATAPIAFLAISRELNAKIDLASLDKSAAAPLILPPRPVQRQARTYQLISSTPSPTPATFSGLSRRLETNVVRISFDTPTLAPMAFVRFCIRYPQDCKVHRMAYRPAPVKLTNTRMAELVRVNRDVNRMIRPQENVSGVMAEEWLVGPPEGDCNDYAVTKRHKLLELGWPSSSLLLAEGVIPSGEHHLVLIVRTQEEDLILDNLNWTVRPVSQIRYEWVRAQQPMNPKFWSMISVTRGARLAMNAR